MDLRKIWELLGLGGVGMGVTRRIAQPQPSPKQVSNNKDKLQYGHAARDVTFLFYRDYEVWLHILCFIVLNLNLIMQII